MTMGNRANLVIVEHGDWSLHYSHWGGGRMLDALAFGPDFALRYIRSHRLCAQDEWTDPLWADGGALVDVDQRRLLFFGDELMTTMPERRAMLEVLTMTWPDYSVGWAYGGTDEIAAYVGADRRWEAGRSGQQLRFARGRDGLCQVVSVVGADGALRLWPLWWGYSAAWQGPSLLNRLPGKGISRTRREMIPESGVHKVELGTNGIADTVRSALQLAATRSARRREVEWLASGGMAEMVDRDARNDAWR
jgi:hypothetical protein